MNRHELTRDGLLEGPSYRLFLDWIIALHGFRLEHQKLRLPPLGTPGND
jgi:hypothetical protein